MEIRYQPDQPIRLNVLGNASRAVNARMIRMSGRRAEVGMDEALPCGAAIKIQMEDSLLLGEIAACSEEGGSYVALVAVREAIPSMSDLAKLVAAVMNEGRGGDARSRTTADARTAATR